MEFSVKLDQFVDRVKSDWEAKDYIMIILPIVIVVAVIFALGLFKNKKKFARAMSYARRKSFKRGKFSRGYKRRY